MQFLKDIFYLFFPKLCASCKNTLFHNEFVICTTCRHDLPIICYKDFKKNKISAIFKGRVPLEKANTFLLFQKEGKVKELIHELKYKGNQQIGFFLGNWFGKLLHDSHQLEEIDYIIPVPLHKKKLRQRGYNQLTTFGQCLSDRLKKEFKDDILIQKTFSKTQTFKSRFDRFSNAIIKFHLSDTDIFRNKHVLLIDDVITTGATLEACCLELLKTENIKISIVTIAFTE
jgi:ComF family protein